MKKKTWSSDRIIGLSAILISIMTLFVLMYQTNLMREQQRLSVLPYLGVSNFNTGGPNFKIILTNNGIGPAFIESIKIIYNGKTYKQDISSFLYKHIPETDSINNLYHSNIFEGLMIPAGETIPMLEINNSEDDAMKLLKLLTKLYDKDLDFEIVYRSIYKERWRITGNTTYPEKLE